MRLVELKEKWVLQEEPYTKIEGIISQKIIPPGVFKFEDKKPIQMINGEMVPNIWISADDFLKD